MKTLTFIVLSVILSGCFTTFREDHYFQSITKRDDKATNYFRLRVEGHAAFSSARYVAGYYDERAVDLFFNELKRVPGEEANIRPIFPDTLVNPGTGEKITPLTPSKDHGAFVMILSTNAKAVADTIGSFAESQVVADAMTNLANRSEIRESARQASRLQTSVRRSRAVQTELDSLFATVPANETSQRLGKWRTHICAS